MNIGRVLFLAILLISASSILAAASMQENLLKGIAEAFDKESGYFTEFIKPYELKESYQNKLEEVFNQYSNSDIINEELEENLLSMTVPAEYRDLHFSLVTSINKMNNQKEESEDLVLIKTKLEKLKQTYGWLAGSLTLFIANNF